MQFQQFMAQQYREYADCDIDLQRIQVRVYFWENLEKCHHFLGRKVVTFFNK